MGLDGDSQQGASLLQFVKDGLLQPIIEPVEYQWSAQFPGDIISAEAGTCMWPWALAPARIVAKVVVANIFIVMVG